MGSLRHKLDAGQSVFGFYVQTPVADVIEMIGLLGGDYVIIDAQHGSFGIETVVHMIRAAETSGVAPLVRVPCLDPTFILKALDAGAEGVVVPDIATADQARRALAAARFRQNGDAGRRSACPGTRAAGHQCEDWPKYVEMANRQCFVWIILESEEAVENAAEIVAVDGLDAVILGTFDLAHDLGILGERQHPRIEEAYLKLIDLATAAGVTPVRPLRSSTPEAIREEQRQFEAFGARIFHVGGDRRLIFDAIRDRLACVKDNTSK